MKLFHIILSLAVLVTMVGEVRAQGKKKAPADQEIYVNLGASKYVSLGGSVKRVSVGSPIADVDAFPPDRLLIPANASVTPASRCGRTAGASTWCRSPWVFRDAIANLLRRAFHRSRISASMALGRLSCAVRLGRRFRRCRARRADRARVCLPAPTTRRQRRQSLTCRVSNDQQVQLRIPSPRFRGPRSKRSA